MKDVGTTLYWHFSGPLLRYSDGILHIHDLNPEVTTRWKMSRKQMLVLAWRCVLAALFQLPRQKKYPGVTEAKET